MTLPPNVAEAGEPIQAPSGDRYDGPDLRRVLPIDTMLRSLAAYQDDDVGYVELWRRHMAAAGLNLILHYDRNGDEHLNVGAACDPQMRHRSRWSHFLIEDLKKVEQRQRILMDALRRECIYMDERPADPNRTTTAMRDFLRSGGRILITPRGQVTEGGGVPRPLLNGTEEEIAECRRACLAYFDLRKRFRTDQHIRRAARMLGERTSHGWWVLEARSL